MMQVQMTARDTKDPKYKGGERRNLEAWHQTRSFSIAIVISLVGMLAAVAFQGACGVWYMAQLSQKVSLNAEHLSNIETWKDKQDGDKSRIDSHLAVLDEQIKDVNETSHRIESKVDTLGDRHDRR